MPDLGKLNSQKERIISTIRYKGPSLPVQIARVISIEPLFASAILSELKAEEKLKTTHMRVGSSPLYYTEGQDAQLENFIQYLNQREKEAFAHLKKSKLLEDEKQTPVIRVALRAIKDFAIPIRIRTGEEAKLYWKYFLLPDSEIKSILQPSAQSQETQKEEPAMPPQTPIASPITLPPITAPLPTPIKLTFNIPQQIKEATLMKAEKQLSLSKEGETTEIKHEKKTRQKTQKPKEPKEFKFTKRVLSHLEAKDIELLETLLEKKSEFTGKVRIDSLFGKQEYLLIAKEKKKLNEEDIALAFHKAQQEKMPALLLSPGDVDKKSLEQAKLWRNLVKFEKLK